MKHIFYLLHSYWKTKRLHFASRKELERYQRRRLNEFLRHVSAHSPYFASYRGLELDAWPEMDKGKMLNAFDRMNTAGLRLEDVFAVALQSEATRDFTPTIGDITVGLSSGTSGQRGIFAVSAKEKAQWAGVVLAKMLPDGLLHGERVALFLRANSNLYTATRTRWITFTFFDLFDPFVKNIDRLNHENPSILVAPAQVLRQLALEIRNGRLRIAPKRVISVAEVLEPLDRVLINEVFGEVHEMYQATEGFIASTCRYGVLHVNEEFLHVEPHWLDEDQQRFMPIITDFSRLTQPIVRYRLNDVLINRQAPCACGRVTRCLEAIEGRNDDMLSLPGRSAQRIVVFADVLSRAFARYLPIDADYNLIQESAETLHLHANVCDEAKLRQLKIDLTGILDHLGVAVESLTWKLFLDIPAYDATRKRRRIVRKQVNMDWNS